MAKTRVNLGAFIFWMLLIVLGGSILLLFTSFRVGERNETTFGNIYKNFIGSWGGEINIIPADFYFEEKYIEKVYNADTKVYDEKENIRYNTVHYFFIGVINVFYFLFIAYLIRFFNVFAALGLSFILTSIMYALYIPNVTTRTFAFKILFSYHFALTTLLSLIFLLPIYRGLFTIVFLFVIFLTIMIPISKSDFIKRWIFEKEENE